MALPNACLSNRPSQFFVEQSAQLSTLLDAVVAEANRNGSRDPELCIEYQEAIGVLTNLLSQAQAFSIQGPEEFRGRWQEVQMFVSKAQAIQDAIGKWNVRTQNTQQALTKKRTRSTTLDVETSSTDLKRHRSEDEDVQMENDAMTKLLSIRTVRPIRATPAAPWWTQTLYD